MMVVIIYAGILRRESKNTKLPQSNRDKKLSKVCNIFFYLCLNIYFVIGASEHNDKSLYCITAIILTVADL